MKSYLRTDFVSRAAVLAGLLWLSGWNVLYGQTAPCFIVEISRAQANAGDTVVLPVHVRSFEEMGALQMLLTWNPDALELKGYKTGSNPPEVKNGYFGSQTPAQVGYIWFDPAALSVTLPDSTEIFSLIFKVRNTAPGFYPVSVKMDAGPLQPEAISHLWGEMQTVCIVGGVYTGVPAPGILQITNPCSIASGNCNTPDGNINYLVSGGAPPYNYHCEGPNGFVSAEQFLNNLEPGVYQVRVTDQNGAEAAALFRVAGPQPPLVTAQITRTSCSSDDGCIDLQVNGVPSFTYTWSTGSNQQDLCGLAPGLYRVTVIDQSECPATDSFLVEPSNQLNVNVFSAPGNCENGQHGSAAALPANGTGPFTFEWSTLEGTAAVTGLAAGAYTVTVADITGCTGVAQTTIHDAGVADWALDLLPLCPVPNALDGTVLLRSGAPQNLHFPVTLQWSSGSTMVLHAPAHDTLGLLSNAPLGFYSVTVVDSLGCSAYWETWLNCFGPPPADSAALVWPGDADDNNAANHHDLLYLGLAYGASGPPRPNASTNWAGQPAPDWLQSTPNRPVNFKNIDTNGDGHIDAADTLAIVANWGRVIDPSTDDPFEAPLTVPGMTLPSALFLQEDTVLAGTVVAIPLWLGNSNMPVDSLYGLSFSITYDSKYLTPLQFVAAASWFGTPGDNLISLQRLFPGQERLDVAITRTDGLSANGSGPIGETIIIIEDDIFFKGPGLEVETLSGHGGPSVQTILQTRGIRMLTPQNTQPDIRPGATALTIVKTVDNHDAVPNDPGISLTPNPASNLLRVASTGAAIESLQVFDAAGRIVFASPGGPAAEHWIRVENWPAGVYSVRVQTEGGVFCKKFICQR